MEVIETSKRESERDYDFARPCNKCREGQHNTQAILRVFAVLIGGGRKLSAGKVSEMCE